MPSITRLLVANRGEIACRVIRSAKAMGLATIAVYSEADRDALHVAMADEAVEIGPAPAAKSYLDISAVLAAAKSKGADAVHPGYGFLSESAKFAQAVQDAGCVFVGPAPETIRAMGDKDRARSTATAAGVPTLFGSPRFSDVTDDDLCRAADEIGYPVLIKAVAGGGGIGMRVANTPAELVELARGTRTMADRAFGDPSFYLERFVAKARHVEVQVFGFGDGSAVHVFDRDCTIQRRFQKVVEEAPAPNLPGEVRDQLRAAAVAFAEAQAYAGAGTVEFIYDVDREAFYFLEMNTRIQVEHAVTEMVTGIDLVAAQLDLAMGKTPRAVFSDAALQGHAIECRLYAEKPAKGFLPAPGVLKQLQFPPEDADLRIDTGVREGDRITPYYDPMIAKLIARGSTRERAIARMRAALDATVIGGASTNLAFLKLVMDDDQFCSADMTTAFVQERTDAIAALGA